MEDSAYPECGFRGIVESPFTVGVADGVGGLPGGDVASSIATRYLEDVKSERDLKKAVINAHLEIQSTFPGSATTLTVSILGDDTISVYWIGDSPAIAIDKNGRAHMVIVPHVQMGTGYITRVLGIGEPMLDKVEVGVEDLKALILATDGLTAHLCLSEIADIYKTGGSLVEEVLRRGATDNIAVATIEPLTGEISGV